MLSVQLPAGVLRTWPAGPQAVELDTLCSFANRQNPKRAFLFVSRILGKHLPVRPGEVERSHQALAARVMECVSSAATTAFIGFAETATGLGAGVFEACYPKLRGDAFYLQTTRYHFNRPLALQFSEDHSHATGHLVYEMDQRPEALRAIETLVLVDDELSTGQTNVNFLKAFLSFSPVKSVVMVSLLNWISPAREVELRALVPEVEMHFVALWRGGFQFEPTVGHLVEQAPSAEGKGGFMESIVPHSYGRFGAWEPLCLNEQKVLAQLSALDHSRPVHVVGDGEVMHFPFKVAQVLERNGFTAYVQSTTRSPILLGGAIQRKHSFSDHYAEGIPNYAYNLPTPDEAQLVLCHESVGPLNLLADVPAIPLAFQDAV